MRKMPVHKVRGDDLCRMSPAELKEFNEEVRVVAQRLFDSVHKDIARYGPWIYVRFWRLASELPLIKSRIAWRDDTIQLYQELAKEQSPKGSDILADPAT